MNTKVDKLLNEYIVSLPAKTQRRSYHVLYINGVAFIGPQGKVFYRTRGMVIHVAAQQLAKRNALVSNSKEIEEELRSILNDPDDDRIVIQSVTMRCHGIRT